jgi:tRNA pseudouridine38-40 synthase
MTHLVLLLAYDGTSYFGWQKTKEGPSVEEEVEKALQQIFQEPLSLQAASRTDRGVHAEGQVVDCITSKKSVDPHRLRISLNQLMPPDIRCRTVMVAPTPLFHPTLDAVRKRYRYSINAGPVQLPLLRFTHWHLHSPFSRTLLKESVPYFLGTRDFRGLCNRRADLDEEHTTRTLFSINVEENEQWNTITISLEGNHFLYKMARNIVGTMMWVAQGKIPFSAIPTALKARKRALAGVTAPAHGLCLIDVFYPFPLFLSKDVRIAIGPQRNSAL